MLQITISYPEVRPKLWRVLHEAEVPAFRRNVPPKMPEVRTFFPNHHVKFGKYWQLLSRSMNPLLNNGNWTAVYDWQLWIANDNGFGDPGDPRANYIENRNLDYELPRVEALTCGGNVLTGYVENGYLVTETLNWRDPAPSLDWIMARPWLVTEGVKLDRNGNPTRFPQGYNQLGYTPGIRHPLLADPANYKVVIPMWRVVEWNQEG